MPGALCTPAVVWSLFWLLQSAVVARVAAASWDAAAGSLLLIAALAWAAATAGWAWRHARWWGRPRADRQGG